MPILVKDYTWVQNSTDVHIKVPLEPVYRDKVDIFTTDCYIKAHFNPFLFEVFLLHPVNIKKSKCVINDDAIMFDLVKNEESDWDSLEKILTKDDKMRIRQEIVEKCQKIAKQEAEDRAVKKSHLDRFTVQQAMDIDNKQHDLMDLRKNEQLKKAMDNLENWRTSVIQEESCNSLPTQKSGVKIVELSSSDDEDVTKEVSVNKKCVSSQNSLKPNKLLVKSEYVEKKKEETAKRVLPKIRETTVVEVTHTPRTFPTPSRESTAEEEQTWLKNITMARRATGFVSEDLRPEEQDPQWCKEKGDEFFRNGNFLGAISAYTHGITLSDKLPTLFANRAATHFALGNFNKCAVDCSSALDLMKPACEGNRRSRAKCIARRAAALARLGYLNKAITEMKVAAKLLPDDEKIKNDIYNMERAWEQNPDSD